MTTGTRSLLLAASLIIPAAAEAQRQADVDAINRLVDRYGALEDAMDMNAQAQLMAPDRVWIAVGGGRQTNQGMNMRFQQAAYDATKKMAPGVQTFTDDRDRLIKFYGDGGVAVASFYRYTAIVPPPNASPDIVRAIAPPPPAAVTLVLEKRAGEWKIVHTHVSPLTLPAGN